MRRQFLPHLAAVCLPWYRSLPFHDASLTSSRRVRLKTTFAIHWDGEVVFLDVFLREKGNRVL